MVGAERDRNVAQSPDYPGKDALLENIGRHRAELEEVIRSLSNDQLVAAPAGGWSIRDHLAHITAWEQSAIALLNRRPRHEGLGVSQATYQGHDVDAVNNEIYSKHSQRPVEDVLAEFRQSFQELLAVLQRMSDEDLRKPYSHYLPDEPGEETGAPVLEWVAGNTYHHYVEHMEVIRELADLAR